jgi:hypothetical protein
MVSGFSPHRCRPDHRQRDVGVRGRDGQVDDQLDLVDREQFGDGAGKADAVRHGLRPGSVLVKVGDAANPDVRVGQQATQVLVGNVSRADDANLHRVFLASHARTCARK